MRIALVYPSYWPYVRRGVERYMHDLARSLVGLGHEVDIITTKPGSPRERRMDGVRTVYLSERAHPALARRHSLVKFYAFTGGCLTELLRGRYDAVHTWMYPYAVALRLARRIRGTPYLYHCIVQPPHLPNAVDRWFFHRAFRGAERIAALTPAAAERITRELGREAVVLSPGVDMDTFRPVTGKDLSHPRVLFTADMADIRKGGRLLLRTWDLVHERRPDATLVLAGPFGLAGQFTEHIVSLIPELVRRESARRRIEILGPGAAASLPRLYAEAAVTVLPSIDEPFGMVLIESLASGTPVVCSTSGGPGEIVTDAAIGTTVRIETIADLFLDTRERELADAIVRTLDLSRDARTSERCRSRAGEWRLSAVARRAEAIYAEMARSAPVRRALRTA